MYRTSCTGTRGETPCNWWAYPLRMVALLRRRIAQVAPVGAGTLLLGVSAYVVLGVAGHSLGARDYTVVASLYLLAAITGPGIFIALEQETNREVSRRVALGFGLAPARRGGLVVAGALAVLVIGGLVALSPYLVPGVLGGSWLLLLAAVVAVAGSAGVYLVRGLLAGERRYGWYATSLALEGGARILPCLVLALLGVSSAAAFGFAFAFGTGVAALLCIAAFRPTTPGPPVDVRRMAVGAAVLAGASGLTYVVANTAPLVLTARLLDQPEIAASFVSLFVIARVPVFLFSPLQAFLLPGLTAAVQDRDAPRVWARLRLAMLAVAAVGLPFALLTALAGPWAGRVFFNAPLDLPRLAAGLLGLSTVAMMAAQVVQPALVALGAHRAATSAWLLGTAAFAALLLVPTDPVAGAIAAQIGAPVVVLVVMTTALRSALRRLRDDPRSAENGEVVTVRRTPRP